MERIPGLEPGPTGWKPVVLASNTLPARAAFCLWGHHPHRHHRRKDQILGAVRGSRTHHLLLGKQVLFQDELVPHVKTTPRQLPVAGPPELDLRDHKEQRQADADRGENHVKDKGKRHLQTCGGQIIHKISSQDFVNLITSHHRCELPRACRSCNRLPQGDLHGTAYNAPDRRRADRKPGRISIFGPSFPYLTLVRRAGS